MDYFNKWREKRSIRNTYNTNGFDEEGYHLNGTKYDYEGYDVNGLDRRGEMRFGVASKNEKVKRKHKKEMPVRASKQKVKCIETNDSKEAVQQHADKKVQSIQQKVVIVEKLQRDVALSNERLSERPLSLLERKLIRLKKQPQQSKNMYARHRVLPPEGRLGGPFDENGFNAFGMHRNGTPLDEDGFSQKGFNQFGFDRYGFNQKGVNEKGEKKQ